MNHDEIKQHFAELCECIWNKIENQGEVDSENAESMRQVVVNFAVIAWNMSLIKKSFPATTKALRKFAAENYESHPCALIPLLEAAELKWHEYPDDKEVVASAEVKMVDGSPRAIAYLKGESSNIDYVSNVFRSFMNAPEIQKRLNDTSPENLEEEIGKIVAEYNASLPEPTADADDDGMEKRSFPITRDELDSAYRFIQEDAPKKNKEKILLPILKDQPLLATLCKNPSISDIIVTIASVFLPDTNLIGFGGDFIEDGLKISRDFVSAFIDDKNGFGFMIQQCVEPNLFSFLAEAVGALDLSPNDFKKNLSILFAWGFIVEAARRARNPDKYPEFTDDEQEEEL